MDAEDVEAIVESARDVAQFAFQAGLQKGIEHGYSEGRAEAQDRRLVWCTSCYWSGVAAAAFTVLLLWYYVHVVSS
jgi:flagellar biosynthesis/type III secretory pathway protein FliH